MAGRASGASAVRWTASADGAFLAARASAGHIVSKLGGSGGRAAGLERNKKSSREDFNVSTVASGRSSAGMFGSGATTSGLPRAAGAYCAGPLGERGVSSPCAGTPWSARGPSARGIVERSRSIAAAETSTDEKARAAGWGVGALHAVPPLSGCAALQGCSVLPDAGSATADWRRKRGRGQAGGRRLEHLIGPLESSAALHLDDISQTGESVTTAESPSE